MKIKIHNVEKISDISIEIKGLTVIAGENNSGKTAIARSLYVALDSLYDYENKIFEDRVDSIFNLFFPYMMDSISSFKQLKGVRHDILSEIKNILSNNQLEYDIDFIFNKLLDFLGQQDIVIEDPEEIEGLKNRFKTRISLSDHDIFKLVVSRNFKSVFNGQISNMYSDDNDAEIKLFLQNNLINFGINNDSEVTIDKPINIKNSAVLINDDFDIDDIIENGQGKTNYTEDTLSSKKFDNIINKIEKIFTGYKNRNTNRRQSEYNIDGKNIRFNNISSGLKTFIYIKELILNNQLKENGVLILDEPEVHLHPKWQIDFAEIIILLQKELNIHVLLITHSPYFLRALNVFSKKYHLDSITKYYLSEEIINQNKSKLTEVTDSVDKIYDLLAAPFNLLDKIEAEE